MKKIILALVATCVFGVLAFAQETAPNPAQIGVDSAQQRLKEISINKFEDQGFWRVAIPLDAGVISSRRVEGSPLDKKPLAAEKDAAVKEEDKYVLGVKAEFFGRTNTTLSIEAIRPLACPGITKTISLWVIGRNNNHKIGIVAEDYFGHRCVLPLGKLNFSGWKQLTVAVPPTLEQRNPHYNNKMGIKILGIVIDPELTETYGSYFVYFDDLRIVTDLFAEENKDPDDIPDNW
jgi:hypothetical protein